jgi:hypothetical protein
VALPLAQSPLLGVVEENTPLAGPHAPLTAPIWNGALQLALLWWGPLPSHDHVHALPLPPATVVALPELHNPLLGAVLVATPSAEPQLPLMLRDRANAQSINAKVNIVAINTMALKRADSVGRSCSSKRYNIGDRSYLQAIGVMMTEAHV